MSVFDRLVTALDKDPELEYKLWLHLKNLKFYRAWGQESHNCWTLKSVDGDVVAMVSRQGALSWKWEIPGGSGSAILEKAKEEVEMRLWVDGWRGLP